MIARQTLLLCSAAAVLSAAVLHADPEDDRQIDVAAGESYVLNHQLHGAVHVDAQNRVAVLTGTVQTDDEKRLAADATGLIPNVLRVDNQVNVVPTRAPVRSDGSIETHVKLALLLHRGVSVFTHVAVRDGVVTLTGTADGPAQKEMATEFAERVRGVRVVLNNMTLVSKPPPTFGGDDARAHDDNTLTAQVGHAIHTQPAATAVHYRLATQAGVVSITGEADTEDQKDLVGELAAKVPGVRSVRNYLTVKGE